MAVEQLSEKLRESYNWGKNQLMMTLLDPFIQLEFAAAVFSKFIHIPPQHRRLPSRKGVPLHKMCHVHIKVYLYSSQWNRFPGRDCGLAGTFKLSNKLESSKVFESTNFT